ncbi:STAS domain-containing protein [Rhodococcus sp. ZPP]|nr:STAS domain-containing protein [Rhodococcus sp. ZPP]
MACSGAGTGVDYTPKVVLAAVDTVPTRCASAKFSSERIGSGVMVLGVRGDIDLFSAPVFHEYVCTQISPEGQFILDMSKVDFIGTAGLSVLDSVHASNLRDGRHWAMICGRPLYRLLRAAGQESSYPCYPSVDSALGAWHGRTA